MMAIIMSMSVAACGENTENTNTGDTDNAVVATEAKEDNAEDTTEVATEEVTEEVTEEATESNGEMAPGVKGDGEQALTSVLFDVTIPEGLKYEVYTHAFADETNGSIEVKFGEKSTLEGSIKVSTQRMTKSLDEVVDTCIALRNLDTYKEGKSEVVGDVTAGDTTYKQINISNEWGADTNFVTYYKTGAGLDGYVEITLENDSNLTIDNALVQALVNSIVYK